MKGTMTITLINTILCSGFKCTIMMDRYIHKVGKSTWKGTV